MARTMEIESGEHESRGGGRKTPDALPTEVVSPLGRYESFAREYVRGLALPMNLKEALEYALMGPGKRVRPMLTLHAYAAIGSGRDGGDGEEALASAAAVEMVHAFSLVHDDLPGIDNDDLRRGRATLHKHTSEAMAILAGDSLLTLAFTILTERYEATLATKLVKELAAGTNAMIAGQIYDTLGGFSSEPPPSDRERLVLIHANKTGALIRAACRMGALAASGGKENERVEGITRYADAVGLMFQIVDDVLDVTQSTDHLGKKSGKDLDAGKLTYPGVMGLQESIAEVARLQKAAMEALGGMGSGAEPLRQIAEYLATRTR